MDCYAKYYNHLKVAGLILVGFFFFGCVEAPEAEREVVIRIPSLGSMRAIGPNYTNDDFFFGASYEIARTRVTSVSLHFWDETGQREVSPALVLRSGSNGLQQIKGAEGYKVVIPPLCKALSVVCNPDHYSSNILDYQGLGIEEIPLVSEKVPIPSLTSGRTVELYPKPQVARLEFSFGIGKLFENSLELEKIRIKGIYVNNFILDNATKEIVNLTSVDYDTANGGVWVGHPEKMHNLNASLHEKLLESVDNGKHKKYADVYYVFPRTEENPQEIDHLIFRFDYERKGKRYYDQFVTIRAYITFTWKDSMQKLQRFEAGKSYNINLGQILAGASYSDDPITDKPEESSIMLEGVVETPEENLPLVDESTPWD